MAGSRLGHVEPDYAVHIGLWQAAVPDDLMRDGKFIPGTRIMFATSGPDRAAIWWNKHDMTHAMSSIIQSVGIVDPGRKKRGIFFTSDLNAFVRDPRHTTWSSEVSLASKVFVTEFIKAIHLAASGRMPRSKARKFKEHWLGVLNG